MRAAVLVIAIAAAPAPAAAGGDLDGNSIVGLGFGGATRVSGALGEHFRSGGGGGRIRMGLRAGRVGAELVMTVTNLDGDLPGDPSALTWTPTFAFYPVATPWFQIATRAGLGYGTIEGIERHQQVPCEHDECITRDEVSEVGFPGFVLDVGVTAQVHLGRRRGGRAILWIDAGTQLARYQLDDGVVSGRIVQITAGIAHGMAF